MNYYSNSVHNVYCGKQGDPEQKMAISYIQSETWSPELFRATNSPVLLIDKTSMSQHQPTI